MPNFIIIQPFDGFPYDNSIFFLFSAFLNLSPERGSKIKLEIYWPQNDILKTCSSSYLIAGIEIQTNRPIVGKQLLVNYFTLRFEHC